MDKSHTLKNRTKSDEQLLDKLFYQTHRTLKHYKANARFTDIFLKGEYDCVTGTALFALLLEDLGFDYELLEFPFHTLLIVNLKEKDILFDATDPLSGFVTQSDLISERLTTYQTDFGKVELRKENIRSIDLSKLIGLQYYNLSVDKFNKNNYEESKKLLELAYSYYPSQRIKELSRYIAISE